MSLTDRLAEHTRRKGARCAIAVILDELNDKQRAELETLLAGSVPGAVLAGACRDEYPDLMVPGPGSFQRHRNHQCKCS